jgi:hypothetical protein
MNSTAIIITILFVAGLAAFIYWYMAIRGKDQSEFKGKLPNNYKRNSPKGVLVYSEQVITDDQLVTIDAGLDATFRLAEREYPGKTFSRHSAYVIYLWPPSKHCTDPSIYQVFNVGPPYDQGEYDKDPRVGKAGICYAGRMIRTNGVSPGAIVSSDPTILFNAVAFECEHNVLREVDMPRYSETSALHNHPIFGQQTASLASRPFKCAAPVEIG